MTTKIDHIMLNVNNLEKGANFYSWLMPKLGYSKITEYKNAWKNESGSLMIRESDPNFQKETFDKRKVGIRELAFVTDKKEIIDEIGKEVEQNSGVILDPPGEFYKNSYRVFFTDPDGIKLEILYRY